MPSTTLGSDAIKIACIQTVPGKEYDVVRAFSSFFKGDNSKFAAFKGLGTFDVIIVYQTPSFEYFFSKAGPIEGILKSNLFLCFPHFGANSKNILQSLSKDTFTFFCLLKLDPQSNRFFPDIEQELVRFIKDEASDKVSFHVLGTLGWTEIILLISGPELDQLFEKFHYIINLNVNYRKKRYALFLKTYTLLSLNYNAMPEDGILESLSKTRAHFSKDKQLNKSKFAIVPEIYISCKPGSTKKIKEYWAANKFSANRMVGLTDIVVSPDDHDMTFGPFMSNLLHFRHSFSNEILSTSTQIQTEIEKTQPSYPYAPNTLGKRKTTFAISTLSKKYGRRWGTRLANDFYSLTQLINNPVIGDAFQGMIGYPSYMVTVKFDEEDTKLEETFLHRGKDAFASNASRAIRSGAELRTYGTYGTVEEGSGRFSRLRGGAQRAVFAAEFVISDVLYRRLNMHWDGFVVSDSYKFSHEGSVVNIPTDSLLHPLGWWALHHEIGHIYSKHITKFLDFKQRALKKFMENKSDDLKWKKLLSEIIAEIIGYELGFYNDINAFTNTLWNYIAKLGPILERDLALEMYLVRSYVVHLYAMLKDDPKDTITKWNNTDFIFEDFIKHIEEVKLEINKPKMFPHVDFFVAKNLFNIEELLPVVRYWISVMKKVPDVFADECHLDHDNTKEVVHKIKSGKVYWENVRFPEAVLYLLIKNKKLLFNQTIALLITFWQQRIAGLYAKR